MTKMVKKLTKIEKKRDEFSQIQSTQNWSN